MLSLSETEQARLVNTNAGFIAAVLQAGTYPGQTQAVRTVAVAALLATRADLPDAEAETLLREVFDDIDFFAAGSAAGSQISARPPGRRRHPLASGGGAVLCPRLAGERHAAGAKSLPKRRARAGIAFVQTIPPPAGPGRDARKIAVQSTFSRWPEFSGPATIPASWRRPTSASVRPNSSSRISSVCSPSIGARTTGGRSSALKSSGEPGIR